MKKLLLLLLAMYGFSMQTAYSQQQLSELSVCGNLGGFGTFNLYSRYAEIIAINQYATEINFYPSLQNAQSGTNKLTSNLMQYAATSNPQTIFVREKHRFTGQYSYYQFDLVTNFPPVIGTPVALFLPSPSSVFDLTTNLDAITNSQSGLEVNFYHNQEDALNGQNAITSPNAYQLTSLTQSEEIWVGVLNSDTGCKSTTSFTINVTNGPVNVPPIITVYLCDTDTDGIITHDLSSSIPQILGTLNPLDYSVSFHQTEENAISGLSSLPNTYTLDTPFLDDLYVRVTNTSTNEFSTTNFLISIKIKPTINPLLDHVLTQRPFTGTASFNIVDHFQNINNSRIIVEDGGMVGAHALRVKFFLTEADAIEQTNAMNDNFNLTSYANISNPQTIWVSATNVTDGVIGCEPTISSYQLRVVEEDATVVYIPDTAFKAFLITLGYDTNNDGKIQFTEASAVTQTISVSGLDIFDLTGLEAFTNATGFTCRETSVRKIDVSHIRGQFDFSNNSYLEYINVKNGQIEGCGVILVDGSDYACSWLLGCPSLRYICVDEGEGTQWTLWGYPNVQLSTYCTFTPGGNFNTITGKTTFDLNANGCNEQDDPRPFLKMKINDGTNNGFVFTNQNADYSFYTQAGNFTVTPEIENPTFFNNNPANAVVNFPLVDNSVSTNNFCLSANGVHPDLEIVIAPIVPARPGFNAVYKIVYKNKGNQVLSQNYGLSFFYNQNLMSFVSADIMPDSQIPSALNWSYANLLPFESRSISVTMRINSPTDANPVNIDDELILTASISPQAGDENTRDNLFVFNQTVVGSYDPNDIQCLQGEVLPPAEIGNYLHYLIRFENTGTDYAENIVVKNIIDPAKYDISSLQILGSSHSVNAKVQGNSTEFIFQNVNLDSGGHGNILLKLKSVSTLQTGDMVSNRVSIYFDYNYPVDTNDAETVFENLSVTIPTFDNSVKIYPNPANEFVNIKASTNINSVEIYDVQGRILATSLFSDTSTSLDLTKYSSGIYYLKIKTEEGSKVEKLIKK